MANVIPSLFPECEWERPLGDRARQLVCKFLTRPSVAIDFMPSECIGAGMDRLSEQIGIPEEQQRWVFQGEELDEHSFFCDYGIGRGATIDVFIDEAVNIH
jgi:hypothetical protein